MEKLWENKGCVNPSFKTANVWFQGYSQNSLMLKPAPKSVQSLSCSEDTWDVFTISRMKHLVNELWKRPWHICKVNLIAVDLVGTHSPINKLNQSNKIYEDCMGTEEIHMNLEHPFVFQQNFSIKLQRFNVEQFIQYIVSDYWHKPVSWLSANHCGLLNKFLIGTWSHL